MKRILPIIIILLFIFPLTSCDIMKSEHEMRPTEQYLYNKYNVLFTFDHYDNNTKDTTNYVFKDDNGNCFTLKHNGYYFSDNYFASIHRKAIEQYLQSNIPGITSLKTSTDDTFTTQNFKSDNFKDYLQNGVNLKCTFYCDINDFNKETLQKESISAIKNLKCNTTINVEVKDKTQDIDAVLFRGILVMTKNGNTEGWEWTNNTNEKLETTKPKEG